jgi:putative transposase
MRAAKNAERRVRISQRSLARCKRASNRRKKVKQRLAKLHGKIANMRATHLHQVSAKLARENDMIRLKL